MPNFLNSDKNEKMLRIENVMAFKTKIFYKYRSPAEKNSSEIKEPHSNANSILDLLLMDQNDICQCVFMFKDTNRGFLDQDGEDMII